MRIRVVFVVSVLALSWVLPAHAQKNRIGLIAGLNVGKFDLEIGDLDTRTGFGIGAIFDFVLNATTAIRITPYYVQKGARQQVIDHAEFGNADITFKTTYFEVPFLLKYGAYAGPVRPYVLGGPTVGFNVSSKRDVLGEEFDAEVDIGGAIKLFDVGAAVGAGVSFPVHDHLFFIEGRYAFSFFNIQHDHRFSQFVRALGLGSTVKNRSFQLMTGVSLLL